MPRKLYMQNDLTYIDVLFQAATVSDFIDRMIYLQAIHRHDKLLIEDTRQRASSLRTSWRKSTQQIAAIEQIKAEPTGAAEAPGRDARR